MLKCRTGLGQIHTVKSVLPISDPQNQDNVQKEDSIEAPLLAEQPQEAWDPPVILSHLDNKQQAIVHDMLRQEAGAFTRNKLGVACIPIWSISAKISI